MRLGPLTLHKKVEDNNGAHLELQIVLDIFSPVLQWCIDFQKHSFSINPENVKQGHKICGAKEGVCQGKGKCRRNESPAILHHPGVRLKVDRCGIPHGVWYGVTCVKNQKLVVYGCRGTYFNIYVYTVIKTCLRFSFRNINM